MKNSLFSLLFVIPFFLLSSCRMGHGQRVISIHENDYSLRIEYSGRVTFTDDSMSIKHISRYGYMKFDRNGKKIEAENRDNKIVYRLNDEEETTSLTESERLFLADAVHEMMKRGHSKD